MVAEAGPEAIIPLDGSGNAMELWQEAGKRLGALEDGPIQIAPSMYSGGKNTDGNGQETKASSNRTIDININGNGSITAGKGVSKDDIVQVTTSGASGFESAIQNVGEIRNNGVEVMVNAVPVHTKDFNWNSTFNIAYNSSDVKYLGIDLSLIHI